MCTASRHHRGAGKDGGQVGSRGGGTGGRAAPGQTAGPRQFSKDKGKGKPKKPGRRRGEGRFERRAKPEIRPTDKVEEIAVNLDDTRCPRCGEQVEARVEEATTIDVPVEPVREVKIFGWIFAVEVGATGRVRPVARP